jgi:integrase
MAVRMAGLQRTKSGRWISRKSIPEDVRDSYYTRYQRRWEEIFHAPAGCPLATAKRQHSEWEAEIDSRIATIRAQQRGEGRDLTQREARALAGEWYKWFVGQYEDNPGKPDGWVQWQWAVTDQFEAAVGGDPEEIDWTAPEVRKEIHPIIADAAKTAQFLAGKGEALTAAAKDMFLDDVIGEFLTATTLLNRRAQGDYSPDQHLQTLPDYRNAAPQSSGQQGGSATQSAKTAMQLFENYIAAAKSAEGTITTRRVVFTTLDEYLAGRDFDAPSDDEAQRWITSLVTNERSAGTVKRTWIASLKAVGRWAVKQHLIARNPFADCAVLVPKKTRNREMRGFRSDEIRLILSAASAITNTRQPGMAARRWVPWICAYTGARGGEITQLRGQDVIERDGIKALRLTPDAGPMKTKEAREMPIHEHLIEQGFLKYVSTRGRGPLFYDSASTGATDTNSDITHPKRSQAVQVRNRLGAWIRSIGITDPEVGPTHGWRHSFKQIADRHGITERVSDAITGHAPVTEGRAYGAPTLEDMADALKLFPRYKLDDPSGSEVESSRAIDPIQPQRPQSTAAAPTNP